MTDLVNHPPHYSASRFGCECIAITRHMTFDAGNAFKYIWRHADKGTPVQDLRKAVWYLRDLDTFGTGVWISRVSERQGRLVIETHVAPQARDTLPDYRPLLYIGEGWIDRAVLAAQNRITDFCDACDGRGNTGPSFYQPGVDNECPECEGSGLRVDQDRNRTGAPPARNLVAELQRSIDVVEDLSINGQYLGNFAPEDGVPPGGLG